MTDWIPKHPGGKIIEFYCNSGEDATQAIQQFHFRSLDRVQRIMAPMKVEDSETKLSIAGVFYLFLTCFAVFGKLTASFPLGFRLAEDKAARYRAIDEDFARLSDSLKKEGYFDASPAHYFYRCFELLALLVLAYCIGTYFQNSAVATTVSAVLLGIFQGRCGWLMHEAGHHSMTGKPSLDRFLQKIMYASLNLLSSFSIH